VRSRTPNGPMSSLCRIFFRKMCYRGEGKKKGKKKNSGVWVCPQVAGSSVSGDGFAHPAKPPNRKKKGEKRRRGGGGGKKKKDSAVKIWVLESLAGTCTSGCAPTTVTLSPEPAGEGGRGGRKGGFLETRCNRCKAAAPEHFPALNFPVPNFNKEGGKKKARTAGERRGSVRNHRRFRS